MMSLTNFSTLTPPILANRRPAGTSPAEAIHFDGGHSSPAEAGFVAMRLLTDQSSPHRDERGGYAAFDDASFSRVKAKGRIGQDERAGHAHVFFIQLSQDAASRWQA
jgi:hypothetical protein